MSRYKTYDAAGTRMYTCRECESVINQASELCPYCGADLTAQPIGEPAPSKKKSTLRRTLIVWSVVVVAVWALVWFAFPVRQPAGHGDAEAHARAALTDIRNALESYGAAEGHFPASLEALGDPARVAVQSAQGVGYRLQYIPAQPGLEGRIHGYSLLARPGNFGFRNFYLDETGILRATREDRPGTPQDPPA